MNMEIKAARSGPCGGISPLPFYENVFSCHDIAVRRGDVTAEGEGVRPGGYSVLRQNSCRASLSGVRSTVRQWNGAFVAGRRLRRMSAEIITFAP